MNVLWIREIAELDEDRREFRRLEHDEACRPLGIAVEPRSGAQAVDQTPREDMGVEPRLPPLQIEQYIRDARILRRSLFLPLAAVCGVLARRDPRRLRIRCAVGGRVDGGSADVRRFA